VSRRTRICFYVIAAALPGLLAAPASAETVAVEGLPQAPAAAATLNVATPASIPVGEKVDGIFIAFQPEAMRQGSEAGGYHYVLVTGDSAKAQSFATVGSAGATTSRPTMCLQHNTDFMTFTQQVPRRPNPAVQPAQSAVPIPHHISRRGRIVAMPPAPPPPPQQHFPSVYRLASESFSVGEGGRATLEQRDLWVDLETKGVREINKTVTPYARVSRGPQGVEIYAARGANTLEVIVRPPPPVPELGTVFQAAVTGTGTETASACGILHVSLSLEEGGAMAAVLGRIAMDGVSPEETEPLDAQPASSDDEHPHPMHVRTLQASISASQTASEKAPLFSVSYAWKGKDEALDAPSQAQARMRSRRFGRFVRD